jgi:hypothetical protein
VATLNEEVRHAFSAVDLYGAAVTGLTGANFTTALTRRSGASLIASAETVAVAEIGAGLYWVYYTPTLAATLYRLTVVPVSASHVVDPSEFQEDVVSGSSATSGPYLTTRANFKTAWSISTTEHDARIDALLPQVTKLCQTYCGRTFFETSATEYPSFLSRYATMLPVKNPPITAITSLHLSLDIPRVYDATTVLVEGTDFIVSEEGQWIEFVAPRCLNVSGTLAKSARLIYTGGYAVIPGDLERAAQEIIGVKLLKGSGKLYHFLGESRDDGSMAGIRFDDVTPSALAVMDSYRLAVIA